MAIARLRSVVVVLAFVSSSLLASHSAETPATSATPDPGLYVLPPGAHLPDGLVALRALMADKISAGSPLKAMIPSIVPIQHHAHADYGGARAALRVPQGALAFYVYFGENAGKAPSADNPQEAMAAAGFMFGQGLPPLAKSGSDFELLHLTVKGEQRTVEFATSGRRGANVPSRDSLPLKIEELGPKEFRLTPVEALPPGEYGLICTAGGPSPMIWDFGVDPKG